MTARPDLVAGPARDTTVWMHAIEGLVAKDGADGVMAGALPDGRAFALKIASGEDGARRAVTAQALRELGIEVDDAFRSALNETRPIVLGHGAEVGAIDPLPWARHDAVG
jgi:L-asparaginase II